ncbi:hypothetical protein PHYC_03050 [Phycisphaerales bacterium]|nr:hypothetical protein PHYC_03050 [Phycisphaerales bacterium]
MQRVVGMECVEGTAYFGKATRAYEVHVGHVYTLEPLGRLDPPRPRLCRVETLSHGVAHVYFADTGERGRVAPVDLVGVPAELASRRPRRRVPRRRVENKGSRPG